MFQPSTKHLVQVTIRHPESPFCYNLRYRGYGAQPPPAISTPNSTVATQRSNLKVPSTQDRGGADGEKMHGVVTFGTSYKWDQLRIWNPFGSWVAGMTKIEPKTTLLPKARETSRAIMADSRSPEQASEWSIQSIQSFMSHRL